MNKLKEAINEAERFLEKANFLLQLENNKKRSYERFPKESGSVKRASMDLTRSLANFRNRNV